MKLFKLVTGKETLGYRLSEIPNQKVQLDMEPELAKEVLGYIDKSTLNKGTLIQMKLKGDNYVSDNEENVIQVETLKECLAYINSIDSSESLLTEGFNTVSEEKKKFREAIDAKYSNIKNKHHFEDLEDYSDYDDINDFINKIKLASNSVKCEVFGFLDIGKWESKLEADIRVPNLQEASKFLHNWYKDKKALTVWLTPKQKVSVENSIDKLSNFLMKTLGLNDGYYYQDNSNILSVRIEEFGLDIDDYIHISTYTDCEVLGYNY